MRGIKVSAAALCSVITAALISSSAFAGGNETLRSWVQEARAEVNEVLNQPHITRNKGNGNGAAQFIVTIDKSGEIIGSEMTMRPTDMYLRSASKRVVRRVDLPGLPANFDREELTFTLNLNYYVVSSPMAERNLLREGRVRGEEVASRRGPLTASIVLHDLDSE